ncbi:MAG: CPBP family intramembrane metalloprotease, partial [Planctomycetales bacterium]
MIFRVKHQWWAAILATTIAALVCIPLGGWTWLLASPWPLSLQVAVGIGCGLLSIVLDGILHGSFKLCFGQRYEKAFQQHGEAVLNGMQQPEYWAAGLMAAVAEEPFFRGVLLHQFENPAVGIVVTAVVFAGCHWLRVRF